MHRAIRPLNSSPESWIREMGRAPISISRDKQLERVKAETVAESQENIHYQVIWQTDLCLVKYSKEVIL